MTTAIAGGEVFVPTLEGEVAIEVPAGTQHGDMGLLRGRGLPPLHGGRRGDQHVVFELVVPTGPRLGAAGGRRAPGRDARPRAALPAEMIRLAVRCEPEYAEHVMANLLELAPNGLEEERGPGWVEFAIYGPPGEVPELGELQAAAGGALVDVTTTVGAGRLGRSLGRLPPADRGGRQDRRTALLVGSAERPDRRRRRSRARIRHRWPPDHAPLPRAPGRARSRPARRPARSPTGAPGRAYWRSRRPSSAGVP